MSFLIPFEELINRSNQVKLTKLVLGRPIKYDKYKRWRDEFIDRNKTFGRQNTSQGKIVDLTNDRLYVTFPNQFFTHLISVAQPGQYLAAHFGVDKTQKGTDIIYDNLHVLLCLMTKGTGPDGEDEIVANTIFDEKGSVSEINFNDRKDNFLKRNDEIFSLGNTQRKNYGFSEEWKAVVHKITEFHQEFMSILGNRDVHVIFVRNNFVFAVHNTRIVFAPADFIPLSNTEYEDDDPILYDHGTGCCPIP